jgi:hypothetical protein
MHRESNARHIFRKTFRKDITPPAGWIIPEEVTAAQKMSQEEKETEDFVLGNLPIATARAEKLVQEIEQKTNMEIPELYLHIADDASFHFMLLVDQESFHSPGMAAAHIIAEKAAKNAHGFDTHFTFSVLEEFAKTGHFNGEEYIMKRVNR